jgi:hypothetical protein
MQLLRTLVLGVSIFSGLPFSSVQAQSISTQERFDDMFITAGYGTALGAALGAAMLSFQAEPDQNLRQIAVGASIGFIGGSLLGSYVVFSPVFISDSKQLPESRQLAQHENFSIQPIIDWNSKDVVGVQSQWKIASF